jgi:coenzyme F420-dependent glucose-6-phosphate dehydrogenase
MVRSSISQDKQNTYRNICNRANTKISSCNCSSSICYTRIYVPERVFLTVGAGEAVNEVPSGNNWPSNLERFERLKEAITLIKKLWTEDWVDFKGEYYWVKDSNLYRKPQRPIPFFIAAMRPQAARLAGEQGDGLVTNVLDPENLKNKVLPAFKEGAEKSDRDHNSLTKAVFMPASYDPDKDKALKSIVFWKGAMIKGLL